MQDPKSARFSASKTLLLIDSLKYHLVTVPFKSRIIL